MSEDTESPEYTEAVLKAADSFESLVEPVEYFGEWKPPPRPIAVCQGCLLEAADIEEYVLAAEECNENQMAAQARAEEFIDTTPMTPDDYVWQEEGTLNQENGHFYCTTCYIAIGMPSSSSGWVCP